MNAGLLIIILLLGLALLGFPIYIALGIGALAALNLADLPLIVLPQRMFAGMNGSALLAIPFFILAGNIMSRSITGKLIDICNAIIGHIKGSLSLVTILASALFGAISGSGVATASAIGGITIPAMKREGYPAPFAVGVASISSILGPIIPPSIVLIVYASITNVSVAELFLGSVLPGIILAVALIAYGLYYGHKHNLPAHEKPNLRKIGSSVRKGIWALLMPIIILGGIYSGAFSPTEAGVVSCVYGLIVGLFLYKELDYKKILPMFKSKVNFLGGMMFCFAPAGALGAVFAYLGYTTIIKNFFLNISSNPYIIVLLIYAFLFVAGMFVQTAPIIVIISPLLLPVAEAVGIDPVHFGIIITLALAVAFVTPPVAYNLFVGASMSGMSIDKISKAAIPFIVGLVLAEIIVGFVPQISMLPVNLFG
mgnify:CR=1 FL=1